MNIPATQLPSEFLPDWWDGARGKISMFYLSLVLPIRDMILVLFPAQGLCSSYSSLFLLHHQFFCSPGPLPLLKIICSPYFSPLLANISVFCSPTSDKSIDISKAEWWEGAQWVLCLTHPSIPPSHVQSRCKISSHIVHGRWVVLFHKRNNG